jgi:hypothetical protein
MVLLHCAESYCVILLLSGCVTVYLTVTVLVHSAELLCYSVTECVTALCRELLSYSVTEWLCYSVTE